MFSEFLHDHPLTGLLCPVEAYNPFPKRTERDRWERLDDHKKEQILSWGNEALQGYPMITATQFLAFSRSGSRLAYEDPYFTRRHQLIGAVLAECVADDTRYLDAIIDGLWCICEETTWVLSAHNGSDHPGCPPMNERPLPDVQNPYVDLFSAQTAATLAITLYLLEDRLNTVSPLIARRVRLEIDKRVLHPFMTHDDFWWMGMIRHNVNNWTPWILSNIMQVFLMLERDTCRRDSGMTRATRMLDSYLAIMPPDGGCDEGAAYFNMAGAALLDCLECLYLATDRQVSFFREKHIRNIAAFPLRAFIGGTYYVNFADCDAQPAMDGERIYRFGQYTQQADLAALGASIFHQQKSVRPLDTPQMNRVLLTLFADIPAAAPLSLPTKMCLPDLQVFAWRHGTLYTAVKGGHNDESHNHNDVGSFLIYCDNQPQVIDLGNCVYTAKTFGKDRYQLMNTRAENHNIPLIGGFEQYASPKAAANDVHGHGDGVDMEIGAAYPECAKVLSFHRSFQTSEDCLTIIDTLSLDKEQPITWVFMLREKPSLLPGQVLFGKLCLSFDEKLAAAVQEIPVTDTRMAKNFPGSVWRLTLNAEKNCHHQNTFHFQRR